MSELGAAVSSIGLVAVGLFYGYRYLWRVSPDTPSARRLSRIYGIAIALAIGLGLLGVVLATTSGPVVRLAVVIAVVGWTQVIAVIRRRLYRELGVEDRSVYRRLIDLARAASP